MFPHDYSDFFHLHLSTDTSYDYDYDFDAHIAQCANVFGPDEKGHSDDRHHPLPIIFSASDGFRSSDSSSPSRSPSIAESNIKTEMSDSIMPESSSSPSQTLMKGHETTRSFDDLHVICQSSPKPSNLLKARRSRMPLTTGMPPSSSVSFSTTQVPESPFSRKRTRRPVASHVHLSEEDADDESDNDTDDEYLPVPRSAGPKRRRTSSQLSIHRFAPPNRSSSTSPVPMTRLSGTSLSRNRQATSAAAIDRACSGNNLSFTCPECGWKQANKRLPDFKRHLRTHTRPDETDQSKGWWCKGVLLEVAHRFSVPKDARPYIFSGQERIGGCMQTFSRRDALKRHLDNANVVCVGRPCEAADD